MQRLTFTGFLLLLMTSCSIFEGAGGNEFNLRSVTLEASEAANNAQPTPVDLVFVYDEEVAEQLKEITAAAWFAGKSGWVNEYALELDVMSHILKPGEQKRLEEFPDGEYESVVQLFVFADYDMPGTHRLAFDDIQELKLQLMEEGMITRP